MLALIVAASVASVFTALFAFRYRTWQRPKLLVVYFLGFAILEWTTARFLLPEGALGIEVAIVCFLLALLFVGATVVVRRLERQ